METIWACEFVVGDTRTWLSVNSDPFLRVEYGTLQVPQEEGDQSVLLRTPGQRLRALPGSQSRQGGAFRGGAEQGSGWAGRIGFLQLHEGPGFGMKFQEGRNLVSFVLGSISSP